MCARRSALGAGRAVGDAQGPRGAPGAVPQRRAAGRPGSLGPGAEGRELVQLSEWSRSFEWGGARGRDGVGLVFLLLKFERFEVDGGKGRG